jgi:hypothetical protein
VNAGVRAPLQNRVRPDGEIVAEPARGTLMGNRGGRIHDPATRALGRRRWASRAWIACELAWKDWRRPVFGAGYTELFFCDEVTALAAGHRPCMLCRRREANAYRAALAAGLGLATVPSFLDVDRLLHAERLQGRRKRIHRADAGALPDGAMIRDDAGAFWAILGGEALAWSPGGYQERARRPSGEVAVLTPPASLAALAKGYRPRWHASALAPEG